MLRRLAPFRGAFDLEAAEAVVADGETVRAADVLDPSWQLARRGRRKGITQAEEACHDVTSSEQLEKAV